MGKHQTHALRGQTLILTSDRALYWKEQKILVIADPHFGKPQVFREQGIPVPGGVTAHDIRRLSRLLDHFNPNQLLVLGDLMHGRIDHPVEFNRQIEAWRRRYRGVRFVLISGNHDLRSGDPPAAFHLDHVTGEILIRPFSFTHKPGRSDSYYVIAGHLHPAVTLAGKGPLKETLSCFSFASRLALLPAFGIFTGNHVIQPANADHIYVIAGDQVIKI